MRQIGATVALAAMLWAMVAMPAAAEWLLMGRHGSCVTLEQAAQRRAEFEGITGPAELAAKLRGQGVDVRTKDIDAGGVRAVMLEAPERNLYLTFATRELCDRVEHREQRR